MTADPELKFSLLTEALIRYRRVADGGTVRASLPQLLVALAADEVRDYPALRPHQRHPWHAFLVQLAVIALHHADRTEPFATADEWQAALLALTLDDPDGAAWCLVTPPDRPAFMQAPVPTWEDEEWLDVVGTADRLDMLATSKNHDLKSERMRLGNLEDWLFALVSLQTQAGSNSPKHRGISRMNSGDGSRSGVGVSPVGNIGKRWERDVRLLLSARARTAERFGLKETQGIALVWLVPWDGLSRIAFARLDPYYIEICRRIRLLADSIRLYARRSQTPVPRIDADARKGATGDPWVPINVSDPAAAKALTIGSGGFDYELVCELLFGIKGTYHSGIAQDVAGVDQRERYVLLARGVARGKDKTAGFHERRVPISPKVRSLLAQRNKDRLALLAGQRIAAIGDVRKLLWFALTVLFNNGNAGATNSDSVKDKATNFSKPFEKAEDARFFDDLNDEVEAEDPQAQRLQWLQRLVVHAESVLERAFVVGPRNGIQRYRAQSVALSRFHGALRGDKSPLPELAHHYRQQAEQKMEEANEHF